MYLKDEEGLDITEILLNHILCSIFQCNLTLINKEKKIEGKYASKPFLAKFKGDKE